MIASLTTYNYNRLLTHVGEQHRQLYCYWPWLLPARSGDSQGAGSNRLERAACGEIASGQVFPLIGRGVFTEADGHSPSECKHLFTIHLGFANKGPHPEARGDPLEHAVPSELASALLTEQAGHRKCKQFTLPFSRLLTSFCRSLKSSELFRRSLSSRVKVLR